MATCVGSEPLPPQTQRVQRNFNSKQTVREPRQARLPHRMARSPKGRTPGLQRDSVDMTCLQLPTTSLFAEDGHQ